MLGTVRQEHASGVVLWDVLPACLHVYHNIWPLLLTRQLCKFPANLFWERKFLPSIKFGSCLIPVPDSMNHQS